MISEMIGPVFTGVLVEKMPVPVKVAPGDWGVIIKHTFINKTVLVAQ